MENEVDIEQRLAGQKKALIIRQGLFLLLGESARNPTVRYDSEIWQKAYDDSCEMIAVFSDNDCYPKVMRTIDHARIEIETIFSQIESLPTADATAITYCRMMQEVLKGEMRIITLKLSHPAFTQGGNKPPVSPLYMNDGFHSTDLVEIITPLYEIGFLKSSDSNPARLKTIVKTFEWAFNVSLPNYDVLRGSAINRKTRLTQLLDKMRDVMIRLSQQ